MYHDQIGRTSTFPSTLSVQQQQKQHQNQQQQEKPNQLQLQLQCQLQTLQQAPVAGDGKASPHRGAVKGGFRDSRHSRGMPLAHSPVRRRLFSDDSMDESFSAPHGIVAGAGSASASPWTRAPRKSGLAYWLGLQTPSPHRVLGCHSGGTASEGTSALASPIKELAFGELEDSPTMRRPQPPSVPIRSPVQSPPPLPPLLKLPPNLGPDWKLVHGYAVPLALLPSGWERIEGEGLVSSVYARLERSSRGVHPSVLHSTQRVLRYLIGSRLDVKGAARRLQCLSRSRARSPASRIPAALPSLRLDQLPHFDRFVASVAFHPCVTFTPEGHPVSLYAINATRSGRRRTSIMASDARELLRRVGEYMDGFLFRKSEETHRLLGIITILDFSGACTQQIGRLWFRILQPVVAESVRLVEDGYQTYIINAPPAFCALWRAAAHLWMSRRTVAKVTVSSSVPDALLDLLGSSSSALSTDIEAAWQTLHTLSPSSLAPVTQAVRANSCTGSPTSRTETLRSLGSTFSGLPGSPPH